jgi:hypothetical protein
VRISILALLLLFVTGGGPGHALSFTPYKCNVNTTTDYIWTLDSASLEDGFELDEAKLPAINYGNNIRNTRHFYANSYVRYFDIHATTWFAEVPYDKFRMSQGTGTAYDVSYNTGTPFWTSYSGSLSNVLQYEGVDMLFLTDNSVTMSGFNIDRVRVKCQPFLGPVEPNNLMVLHERYTGILLAQDDVVNFRVAGAHSGNSLNISLWGPPGANRDVDLYVRCAAQPTPSIYTAASLGASTYEYVRVSATQCASSSELHITVHNRGSSSGSFHLMTSEAKNSSYRSLHVGVEGGTSGELSAVRATMLDAAKQFYGLTEGQMLLEDVTVTAYAVGPGPYWGDPGVTWPSVVAACQAGCAPSTCDICFYRKSGGAGFATTGITVVEAGAWGDPDLVVHELMHNILAINWDEYDWTNKCNTCGHGINQNSWSRSNNLCYGIPALQTNHPKDKAAGCVSDTHSSGWHGQAAGLIEPSGTPDIYNFVSHPFLGVINVH